MKGPANGAITTVNCAVNPELNNQQCYYYSDAKATPSSELYYNYISNKFDTVHLYTKHILIVCFICIMFLLYSNTELQEQLWEISSNIVKEWLSPELFEDDKCHINAT